MAPLEQFLDDYKISHVDCDSDDSEDDRHSDEEDAVEEHLDDNIDFMCDVVDSGDHGKPENTDVEHSETGESADQETNVFQVKDFTWSRTPPKVA